VNILHAIKYYSPWELGEHEQDSLVIEINKICRDCGISLESNPTADLDKADEETIYQSLLNRLEYLIEESWGSERKNSVYLLDNLRQIRWSSYNSTGMLLPADRTEPPFARYKDSNCPPTVAQLCYFFGRHAFNAYRFNNDVTYRALARNLTSHGHPFDLRSHGPNLNQVSSGHAAREIHSTISPAGPVVQKGPTPNSKRKDIGPSQGPEQKLSRVLCPRCGHNCFIAKAEHCRFHTHPDVNAFGTVSWEGSKAQQAWAAVMDPTGQPYRSIQRGHTAFQVHGVKSPLVRVDNFALTT
jgi:ribosomal protein L37E